MVPLHHKTPWYYLLLEGGGGGGEEHPSGQWLECLTHNPSVAGSDLLKPLQNGLSYNKIINLCPSDDDAKCQSHVQGDLLPVHVNDVICRLRKGKFPQSDKRYSV